MGKALKIILIVLGVILAGVLIFTLINIKSVLLFLGIGKLDVKNFEKAESFITQSENYKNTQVENSVNSPKSITSTSKDGVVDLAIQSATDGSIKKVDAKIHGEMLNDVDPTDVNALTEKAKTYIGPIISDDQVIGLSGFVAKEALSQYNQGKTQISITKDFDGIAVSIHGDINTREFTAEIVTQPQKK